MFLVGTIVGTFGNKGLVKVLPSIEPAEYLLEMPSIYIESDDGTKQKLDVLTSKKHKNIYIFSLQGINDMNVAEALSGSSVYVPTIEIKELQENEFYYHELKGLTVYSENGDQIGTVDHIIKGGNDILVIKNLEDKEIMIPFVDELVPEVNLKEKTITVSLIEGLA